MAKYVYPAILPLKMTVLTLSSFQIWKAAILAVIIWKIVSKWLKMLLRSFYMDMKKTAAKFLPSARSAFSVSGNDFVNFIACDTMKYIKMYNNKAVKRL